MTFADAGRIMISGNSKKPVIQAITVTQYGDYEITVPEGVDGYNPIHVNLKDRYDEGYNTAKKIYEKIIEQLNGDGETVADDSGNTIDNAIVTDDDSEINDILRGIVFPNGGGSVSVDGLTGADTYFRIDQVTTVYETGVITKGMQLVIVNKLTGETKVTAHSTNIQPSSGNTVTWKIESVAFNSNRTSVTATVIPYVNGVARPQYGARLNGLASNVGGTSFGSRGSQTAITQQGA